MSQQPGRHEAVEASLFAGRFASVASEMGELLRRMSLSTNVKERLDFSCALLDPAGRLLVNAPHIPVHLGALGLCIREVLAFFERAADPLGEGDVVVTNHPGFGGSHLPDVTMLGPVYWSGNLIGFAASRAHHAEIGGIRPGSMPPNATNLEQEGVVLAPFRLARDGQVDWTAAERGFERARHPSRSVSENLADLAGALAAHRRASTLFAGLAERYGMAGLSAQMDGVYRHAATRMDDVLRRFGDRQVKAEESLDNGAVIAVEVTVEEGRAVFDFEGSSSQLPDNFNATPAIVRSAVLYCLRLMLDEDLPLNEGLLDQVEIRIPEGCFLNPHFPARDADCPAVVAGNVESSQRLVDTVIKALGYLACGQGTMNNLVFGNESFGYYETICGGAGASERRPGASAVHTHMTNTRITDPEILELRYPVRLWEFAVRRQSGGAGRSRGGDGARRCIEALAPLEFSFLSQHRATAPFGVSGGAPGAVGRQWILRANDEREDIAGVAHGELAVGDRLTVETPGGGGFGVPSES